MQSLRRTHEAKHLIADWKEFTHDKDYQLLMSQEAQLILQTLNLLQIEEKDRILTDPSCSPAVYDAFHFIYIYFKAVAEGEMEPLLDFITEGKFHDDFVGTVKFDEECYSKFEVARQQHIEDEARRAIQEQID